MLRIISGLLLLIISQFNFASVTSTTSTVPATSSGTGYWHASSMWYGPGFILSSDACKYFATQHGWTFVGQAYQDAACHFKTADGTDSYQSIEWGNGTVSYTCSSGYRSDSSGVASSSGQFCTISSSVDSCTSQAGQSALFWVSKQAAPATICSGTCLANISGSWGDLPDADPDSYTQHQYTYTGATGECTSDTGFTDDATASAANEAAAERERLAKIQQAISDAISACGGVGTYTQGTFNGDTIITCKTKPTQTTVNDTATSTTTTANPDGSTTTTTTTTTTNNTTVNNNNSSTTVGSNGGSSTTSGTTGGSSSTTTRTETTTTNPDGSTTTDVTETTSGAGNTAGVFESPGQGTDFLKDVFGSESIKQLVDQQESVKDQIKVLQSNIKGLFSFSSIAAGGSMAENRQTIMGASVDLSGKSVIDMFTQGNIGSAFWILAVLIGISIILTKRNN